MKRQMFASLFAAALLATAGSAMAADPTLHEVYQAAESGQLKKAEAMMDQVLKDHPNSGKAHFVEAELLAKEGRIDMARAELATAERLSPGLAFAKPGAVSALRARLSAAAGAPAAVRATRSAGAGTNWTFVLLGLMVLAAFIFFVRTLMRPRMMPAGYGYAGGPGSPQTFGGPATGPMAPMPGAGGMGGMGGGIGSGMLGGLATGVAVGAGVAAGEALMHRVLDGGQSAGAVPSSFDSPAPFANDDMGGSDFGISDGGSWDDGGSSGGDDWN